MIHSANFLHRLPMGKKRWPVFGVLECVDAEGNTSVLRAFSGQFNTRWQVKGWVPPTFDLDGYNRILPKIEAVTHQLSDDVEFCKQKADHCKLEFQKAICSGGAAQKDCRKQMKEAYKALYISQKKRRTYSQSKLIVFQDLYQLKNFKGNQRSIRNVFYEDRGVPTGSGDCCAPKLLHAAARNGLTPLGLTEFYFGRENFMVPR